jgi:hypothetical protein
LPVGKRGISFNLQLGELIRVNHATVKQRPTIATDGQYKPVTAAVGWCCAHFLDVITGHAA